MSATAENDDDRETRETRRPRSDTERYDAPAPKRMKPEHLTLGGIVTAIAVGGGGLLSFTDVNKKLDVMTSDFAAVRLALTKLEERDLARAAAEAKSGAVLDGLREEIRELERASSKIEARVALLEAKGK